MSRNIIFTPKDFFIYFFFLLLAASISSPQNTNISSILGAAYFFSLEYGV
jgi:hypothetical protein